MNYDDWHQFRPGWLSRRSEGATPPSGGRKAPFSLQRGRLSAAEKGLLWHLERLAAAYPGRAFSTLDAWLQYSQHADQGRGGNGHDLRADFDRALAGLAEHELISWQGDMIEVLHEPGSP